MVTESLRGANGNETLVDARWGIYREAAEPRWKLVDVCTVHVRLPFAHSGASGHPRGMCDLEWRV
eukprot:1359371-Pyramimonas_sp.AAC.1